MLLLKNILNLAVEQQATDIHIIEELKNFSITFRSQRSFLGKTFLELAEGRKLLDYLYYSSELSCIKNKSQNFYHLQMNFLDLSLRLSLALKPQAYIALRLHRATKNFELNPELEQLKKICQERFFLIIIGKINTGKTTAYYNILNYLYQEKKFTLASLEEPIEKNESFWQVCLDQNEQWLEVKEHLLRFDLNCIGFAEIRKKKYFLEAKSLFLSGHNLICTTHAQCPQQWLERQNWIDEDLKLQITFIHAQNKHYSFEKLS